MFRQRKVPSQPEGGEAKQEKSSVRWGQRKRLAKRRGRVANVQKGRETNGDDSVSIRKLGVTDRKSR